MKKLLLLITMVFAPMLMAQAPAIEWQKTYGTPIHEYGRHVQQTTDGGYVMTTNTAYYDGFYVIGLDISIYKLSSTGVLEWQKTLGGTDVDTANSTKETADGGYIVAGYTRSNDGDVTDNPEGSRAWIVKLTSTGVIEWQKTLEDVGVNCIQPTADGGFILAGSKSFEGVDFGRPDFCVAKLSSSGMLEWEKTYGGTGQDYAYTIKLTDDGGYIVGGTIDWSGRDVLVYHASYDIWMVKLSASGELEWQKTLGGMNGDIVHDIELAPDGGYILACETSSNGIDVSGNHGQTDVWIVKLSNSGILQWQKAFGGGSLDIPYSIEKTTDGGYIIGGTTYSHNGDVTGFHGDIDAWIIKISDIGILQWQKALGGTNRDDGHAVQQTADGGFIMVGVTFSNNGDVSVNHGSCDAWLVKLNAELATTTFSNQEFKLFPNPANQFLNIENRNNQTIEKIIISDLTGKILMEQSTNLSQINVSELQQGIYFIQIQSQGKITTQKFIKQ